MLFDDLGENTGFNGQIFLRKA